MKENTKNPLISIIIMSYNNFEHMYEAIDSVLEQNYPRIELIIADDGSKSFPETDIQRYISTHKKQNIEEVIIYSNKENLGTVRNSNVAHGKVTGKYIISLACDDCLYDQTTAAKIVDRMEETGCGLLAASRIVIDSAGEPQYYLPHILHRKRMMRLPREKQYRMLVSGMFYAMFSGSALAFRTSSFREIGGFDEKYTLWEDGPYLEKYLRSERVEPAFDIVMIRYRLGGVSTGGGHPKLTEDLHIYNQTDRISHLDQIGWFYRKLTIFNIQEKKGSGIRGSVKNGNLLILIYKVWYKMKYLFAERVDRMIVKRRKDTRNAGG